MNPFDDDLLWEQAEQAMAAQIDSTVPHSARVWNYWMGGKDNYETDRLAGDACAWQCPAIIDAVRQLWSFTGRAVRFLAHEGVCQYLDIGTSFLLRDHVHEVAQRMIPGSRVVYADNDPAVLCHARALLTSWPPGGSVCIDADLTDLALLLDAARGAGLDFTQPVAIILVSVLGHIGDPGHGDDRAARSLVNQLSRALPSGGWLVIGDLAETGPSLTPALDCYNRTGAAPYRARSPRHLARLLDGLDLAAPGVVPARLWRPGPGPEMSAEAPAWAGLGRKP